MLFNNFRDDKLIEAIDSLRLLLSDKIKSSNDNENNVSISMEIGRTNDEMWNVELHLIKSSRPDTSGLLLMLNLSIKKSNAKAKLYQADDIKAIQNYLQRLTTTEDWIAKIEQTACMIIEYSGPSRPPR